jgi:hypothetical protein
MGGSVCIVACDVDDSSGSAFMSPLFVALMT